MTSQSSEALKPWPVLPLGAVAYTSSGTTPARANYDRYYKNGTLNWVKTLDLNNSELSETEEQVTEAALEETSLRCYPAGTVLIAMYGGYNQIGRTALLRTPAAVNQAITAIQPLPARLSPEYLLAVLNHHVNHWQTVASSSRKDPNITSHDVREFPLPLPSVREQWAIAEILQTIDALIWKLDTLLKKKRDLKLASMQQLLTGRARLPSFSGNWAERMLGEIVSIRKERVGYSSVESDKVCIELEHIEAGRGRVTKWLEFREGSSQKTRFEVGDVLFGRLRAYLRKYWLADRRGVCSTEIWPMIADRAVLWPEYLFHLATTDSFIAAASAAYGTHMPRSDWSFLRKLICALPPLDEQRAIAAVLSDMDGEINKLHARRDKALHLKQGMMQQLLSGRIRLA
jgi:type I restriction enzyme S subunit